MLLAVTIPAVAEFEEIQSRMTEFTLTNGMKFIVLERHQAPVVSCLIYAQVGSVDEPKGMSGLSHFIEHLAFKGTLYPGYDRLRPRAAGAGKGGPSFPGPERGTMERQRGRCTEIETA